MNGDDMIGHFSAHGAQSHYTYLQLPVGIVVVSMDLLDSYYLFGYLFVYDLYFIDGENQLTYTTGLPAQGLPHVPRHTDGKLQQPPRKHVCFH